MSSDHEHLGVAAEGDVGDGVRVIVDLDRDARGALLLVLLEQFLRPESVQMLHVGRRHVPESDAAVTMSRH